VQREVFVLALVKNQERFVYVYDLESTDMLLEELQERAADESSALNGFDVAILAGKMREQVAGRGKGVQAIRQAN
jgi:hypothetical protein